MCIQVDKSLFRSNILGRRKIFSLILKPRTLHFDIQMHFVEYPVSTSDKQLRVMKQSLITMYCVSVRLLLGSAFLHQITPFHHSPVYVTIVDELFNGTLTNHK